MLGYLLMDHWKDNKSMLLRLGADLVAVTAAWFAAYILRFYVIPGGIGKPLDFFARLGLIVIVLFLFFMYSNKLYTGTRILTWIDEISSLILASIQSVLGLVIILYFFFPARVSRLTIFLFLALVVLFLIIERILVKNLLFRLRAKGWNMKNVLLIGYGEELRKYYEFYRNPIHGIRMVGQYGAENTGQVIEGLKQLKGTLESLLEKLDPDIVVISIPESANNLSQKYIAACYDKMSSLMVILDFPFSTIGTQVATLNGQHVLQINHTNLTLYDRFIKRLLDIVFSLLGLILLFPLLLFIAVTVKITSKGPVLFVQKRVTVHNRVFNMLKFRTMKNGSSIEEGNGTDCWTVKNDPRVTRFGRFLRRTSLDELPQLINVLSGNMSLIGPRPERPELSAVFGDEIPGYRLRHKVKTGMSGWAQVNGWRGNTSLSKRIEFDLYYIQNWSLLLDIKIVILTIVKGFINKNAY